MDTRDAIERGWYYVIEPDGGAHARPKARIVAGDGRVLTRHASGWPARVEVIDNSGEDLPTVALLRAAASVGRWSEASGCTPVAVRVRLGPTGTSVTRRFDDLDTLEISGPWVASVGSYHVVDAVVGAALDAEPPREGAPVEGALPDNPVPCALFFESLMNSDMPHNDREISQGVLHMVSSLRAMGTEVVLAKVKMPIIGDERLAEGLDSLAAAVRGRRVGLVGITLLEGYFEGVVALIAELRRLGCRAHVAVGGVMPTLSPEQVAAHLPDVSFVCRGAGEVFIPALARILGDADIDTPFTAAQVRALLALDGSIAIDRAGRRLVAGDPSRVVRVADLDRVSLDLSLVESRHVDAGIELSTSRGCVHRCTFCSIIGRESYQARSAEGVFELLSKYDDRLGELFGLGPRDARGCNSWAPRNAYRVHLADDDFACDKERARDFFRRLPATPFRLASAQVSIADLCRWEGGRLLAEPDVDLLDAITPACFADAEGAPPTADYVADHRSRRWSSFLQIGVESFADAELVRLGKPYRLVHLRAIVAELARRRLHFDAYFIQSNADTSADDLVDVVSEICRLKLRYPLFFHLRFPIVPRLVSYFPSASYRRRLRNGTVEVCALRAHAALPGFSEFDYPFVEHDVPWDGWVRAAIAAEFFTDEQLYTGSIGGLAAAWRAHLAAVSVTERARGVRLLRVLDDLPRRLGFELLSEQRRGVVPLAWPEAVRRVELALGPAAGWTRAFRRYAADVVPRVVVDPEASPDTLARAVDLLLSSERSSLELQLDAAVVGRNPDPARSAMERALAGAQRQSAVLRFVVSGARAALNSSMDDGLLAWLRDLPAVIQVVYEAGGHGATDVLLRLADRGVPALQVGLDRGGVWTDGQLSAFAGQLHALSEGLAQRWAAGACTVLVNCDGSACRRDVTVASDGAITGSAGAVLGHLDDHGNVDRYWLDDPAPGTPAGAILASFVKWMRASGPRP